MNLKLLISMSTLVVLLFCQQADSADNGTHPTTTQAEATTDENTASTPHEGDEGTTAEPEDELTTTSAQEFKLSAVTALATACATRFAM